MTQRPETYLPLAPRRDYPMPVLSVSIKHAGKAQNIDLDTDLPPSAFKQSIYQVTGVPPDRMKVMSKGAVLKDDTPWSKLSLKPGHQFMVIGAAGELPKPPEKPVVFLEDMGDAALASVLRLPVGLSNLGNTCYMNSTLQALRAIPELQPALDSYQATQQGGQGSMLTTEMRRLYQAMGQTTEAFTPAMFLQRLRIVNPQFAEQRLGQAYAQQDAEECLGTLLNTLRESAVTVPGPDGQSAALVDKYIMGEMTTEFKCDEAPDEAPTVSTSKFSKIDCNISITTNYMHTGIKDALDQKIDKHSTTLGRSAVYSQTSRISRLPSNLVVHMVRFYWRRDINKKAKIMRKVKFPFEFDVMDLVTDELKQKLLPVNVRFKEIEKERDERRKVRKRTKKVQTVPISVDLLGGPASPASPEVIVGGESGVVADEMEVERTVAVNVAEENTIDETAIRKREEEELLELVHPDLKADLGANFTGVYELVSIITHKGASADGGHYLSFLKASAVKKAGDPVDYDDDDQDQWIKFDDDKVSMLSAERVGALDGGGEESAAYILMYRSKRIS